MDNNIVNITGYISETASFSHEYLKEKFYIFEIDIPRKSGLSDSIKVIISERISDIAKLEKNQCVKILGQFRSHNCIVDGKSHLILTVFVKELELTDDKELIYNNTINLSGYICKNVIYRKTPLGREIADILLAVNRAFKKSDYIPCIAWGRNAKYASKLSVGSKIDIEGRLQSRIYTKLTENGSEDRIAYEVSVITVDEVEKNDRI